MASQSQKSAGAEATAPTQDAAQTSATADAPAVAPVDPFALKADEAPEGGRFFVNGVLVDSEGRSDAEREAEAKAEEARRKADQAAAEEKSAAAEQVDIDRLAAQKAVDDEAAAKRKEALANRPKPTPPKPTPTPLAGA